MTIKYIHKNTNFLEFFIFKTNFFWSIYLFNFYNFTISWTYKIIIITYNSSVRISKKIINPYR